MLIKEALKQFRKQIRTNILHRKNFFKHFYNDKKPFKMKGFFYAIKTALIIIY